MNKVVHKLILDMKSIISQQTIDIQRYDTGRKLAITLTDEGKIYQINGDCKAVFTASKPDGSILFNECDIVDNTIEMDLEKNPQVSTVVGEVKCEIRLYGANSTLITSPCFSILVDRTVYTDGDIIDSSSEYSALTKILNDAKVAMNNTANAFKKIVRGAIVSMPDVSPLEHIVDCKVKSINLFNDLLDYVKTQETEWTYENGTLFVANHYVNKFITLEEGKVYTFSCTSTKTGGNGGGVYIRAYTEDKKEYVLIHYNTQALSPKVTFTMPYGYPVLRLTFYGDTAASTYSATYSELMLVEGTDVTEYIPYVDPATATIDKCGKNLFTTEGRTVTNFGAYAKETVRSIADGCIYTGLSVNNYYSSSYITSYDVSNPKAITFNVSNAGGYGLGFSFKVLPGENYTLSSSERPVNSSRIALSFYGDDGVHLGFAITPVGSSDSYIAATVPDGAYWMVAVLISTIADADVTFKNVQLEVGDKATLYESYKPKQTYSPIADGTVEGVASLYPHMTLLTDTDGTEIVCEYNRDSNKVLEELLMLMSQGGLSTSAARIVDVSIYANKWVGTESPYSQVVAVEGATEYSQVDLTPSVEQLSVFHNKDLAFVTENVDGVVTVYAIGQKPENDYTIQATVKEVMI